MGLVQTTEVTAMNEEDIVERETKIVEMPLPYCDITTTGDILTFDFKQILLY